MNSIFGLWKKRLIYFFRLYYQFVAFQFDSVILAYTLGLIGIMILIYFPVIKQYIYFLSKEPWPTILQIITLIAMLKGKIKGYLKGADEVFLSPMNSSGKKFIRYSEIFCITLGLIKWGIFVFLLYGINSVLQVGGGRYFFYLYIMGGIIKIGYMYLGFVCYQRYKNFYGRLLTNGIKFFYWIISYAFINWWFEKSPFINVYGLLGIVGGLLFVALLQYFKKNTAINWSRWIADESNERARIFALLLQNASKEKYNSKKSTLPIFSGRKLEPFNKRGALLLLYYRILFRGKGNLTLIFQIFVTLLMAVVFIHESLAITILHFFGVFLLSHLLTSFWGQLQEDVWVKAYPFNLKDRMEACIWGPFIIVIPLILLLIPIRIPFGGTTLHPMVELVGLMLLASGVIYIRSYMMILRNKV